MVSTVNAFYSCVCICVCVCVCTCLFVCLCVCDFAVANLTLGVTVRTYISLHTHLNHVYCKLVSWCIYLEQKNYRIIYLERPLDFKD